MSVVILKNPKRPPKKWFDQCKKSVMKRSPEVDDPNALCGWIWYHQMKPATRRKILKQYENSQYSGALKMNKPKSKKRVAAGKARTKIYVGVKSGKSTVFKCFYTPTQKSHGSRYTYVIGPFDTMRGAKYMADYGRGNPHLQTVADAERLSKRKNACK